MSATAFMGLVHVSPVTLTYEGLNGHIQASLDRTGGLSLRVALFQSAPHASTCLILSSF